MNLLRETENFLHWYAQVMSVFLRVRPGVTVLFIIASVISRITSLLAFFLPLKVILLAGSSGVPRYFPFIDPAEKMAWIIGLAGGAFVCYGLTLVLDAWTDRMSARASVDIIRDANAMAVLRNQSVTAKDYYVGFCLISVDLLFVSLGFLLLAFLNTWLFFVMTLLVVSQYFLTWWAVSGEDKLNPGKLRAYVQGNLKNFLKILASVNFLTAFVVILIPFLRGVGGNILIAIISVIFLRQALGALADAANSAVRLGKDKLKVNALVFREHQLESRPELRRNIALRDMFNKHNRQRSTTDALLAANLLENGVKVDVCWADSAMQPVGTLFISVSNADGENNACFYQQIFSARDIQRLENEEFLFRHATRSMLKAPEALTRFTCGDFECMVYSYGKGETVAVGEWPTWRVRLLKNLWTCMPPKSLVKDYNASRPLLYQRLNDEKIGRVFVGVDSAQEERTLQLFKESLPTLQARLQIMPLYIYNPDLTAGNTVYVNDDEVAVMTWGRWSLEPLGAGRLDIRAEDDLVKFLPRLKEVRSDVPDSLSADDIRLAANCCYLEFHIIRQEYKAALRMMGQILASPLLGQSLAADT